MKKAGEKAGRWAVWRVRNWAASKGPWKVVKMADAMVDCVRVCVVGFQEDEGEFKKENEEVHKRRC